MSLWGSQTGSGEGGGSPGAPGAPGTDGKTVLNGTTAPSNGLGATGDFYINTTTWLVHGPKSGGAWPTGVSIIGPAGANGTNGTNGTAGTNGADGRTLLSGSGVPSNGLGANGDFYINTAANTLYGPKASGVWGSATSLVGPQGIQGIQGEAGPAGSGGSGGVIFGGNANTDFGYDPVISGGNANA